MATPCERPDGDIICTQPSKGLGFSHEDRNTNADSELGIYLWVCWISMVWVQSYLWISSNDGRGKLGFHESLEVYFDTPLKACV